MKNFIAERCLIAERIADGLRKDVAIRIGVPYWIEAGEEAACAVQFEGLPLSLSDRRGVDLLQALQIASDIDVFLVAMEDEFKFYWRSGEPYKLKATGSV